MQAAKGNKKDVYIDTSIISYLVDTRLEIKTFTGITTEWWKTQRQYFYTYLSAEVLAELETGNYPQKDKAIKIAFEIELLERNKEIIDITEIYLTQYLMPKDLQGDD